jgi:hypothetical protein
VGGGFLIVNRGPNGEGVEAALCVALAPPASAATWLRWQGWFHSAQLICPLAIRRGPDWCREFAAAFDKLPCKHVFAVLLDQHAAD